MIKIFPHVLMRVSGGPFQELESLNTTESIEAIKKIVEEKAKKNLLKEKLSNDLFSFIQQVTDSRQQNLLLNIRRDIFNNRKVSTEKIKEAHEILPEEIKKDLKEYLSVIDTIKQLEANGEPLFSKEQLAVREKFKKLVQNENLQKGLLLSSKSLLDQMHLYLGRDSASLRKKEQQIEQGLIKYVTRMYAKTSPFSTFTNLTIGQLVPDNSGKTFLFSEKDVSSKVISHIRLNNYIFQYLKTLFFKTPAIYHNFLLRPNPTISQEQEMYVFLTNHNNVEAFQRIPLNGVLELLVELCSQHKDGIVYKELIQTILDNQYIDASAEELDEYIQQLVQYGFFEYNIGVSGIDPDWDLGIVEKLHPLGEELPLIKELIQVLKDVRKIAIDFGNAGFTERKKLIDDAYAKLRAICMKLHEAAGLPADERKTQEEMLEDWKQKQKEIKAEGQEETASPENSTEDEKQEELVFKHHHRTYFYFKPEQLFYEDTTLDISPELDGKQLMEFIQPLRDMLQKLRMFEGYTFERIKMADYFEKKYQRPAKVDLLTFYEDFYRDVKKVEAEIEDKMKKAKSEKDDAKEGVEKEIKTIEPLPVIAKIKALEEKNKGWQDQFSAIMEENVNEEKDRFVFGLKDIDKTLERYPHSAGEKSTVNSQGLFVQFFTEKDEQGKEKLMGVLNSPLPGFGKLMSRFLHIFDEKVTKDIRDWNQAWIEEDVFVEGCDASVFNANLHPTLMPYETWMPGSQNSLPSDKHIPITDIAVCVEDELLKLVHKPSEKRLYTFDLGFQGIMGRSRLFQLMSIFSLVEHLVWSPLTGRINGMLGKKDLSAENNDVKKIIFRPRIVFEDKIILQRKMWFVPKELLPLRQTTETDWAYFEKVNEWRISNGLPNEAFIFIGDRSASDNSSAEDRKKLGKDDYKPQYMNFSNPLLVNLFEKAITKVPVSLKIEEMLPGSEQLFQLGKEKHIIEFMVQWYEKNSENTVQL